jgi:Tfp pilus assembly protein PilO
MNLQEMPYWGQLLLVAGFCAIAGVVFYMFFYSGEVSNLQSQKNALKKKQDEVRQYEAIERNMKQLEQEIIQIKADIKTLESILPTEKESVEIYTFITKSAKDHDIELDQFRPAKGREEENYVENIIEIEKSRGRTLDYIKFFKAVVSRGQVLHIHGLTLKRSATRDMAGDRYPVTASFKISTFVYRPAAEGEG